MFNKKKLAINLSKLKTYDKPKISLEQYQLDSEIAAEILWFVYLHGDIKNKVVADLGCGNGILGKGALLLDAKKVYFIEKDKEIFRVAKENIKDKKAIFVNKDIKNFNKKVDIVLQNPPFGTKQKHNDKSFLKKAMEISDKIYSIHKITSENFVKQFSKDNNFEIVGLIPFNLSLKKTYKFHRKRRYNVEVACFVLKRNL